MTHTPVCIRCGDHYLFTNTYKGNYCPDCHRDWVTKHDMDSTPYPPRPRRRSSPAESRPQEPEPPTDDEAE